MPYVTSFERLAKEEGRQEGREEGRAAVVRVIRGVLSRQLGRVDAGLLTQIETLSLPAAQALADHLGSIQTEDELRELLSKSQP